MKRFDTPRAMVRRRVGRWKPLCLAAVVLMLLLYTLPTPVPAGEDHSHAEEAGEPSTAAELLQPGDPAPGTVYVCPMNCVPPMEKAGRCPVCGMDLVAVDGRHYRHEGRRPVLVATDENRRTAGIRVAAVERRFVETQVRLYGRIEYDPVEQYKVTAFAPGVIDRIYVKRAGQTVRRGDPLFDMHSSELYFLEEALFEVLKKFPDELDYRPSRGQRYRRLMRPARRSLTVPGEEDLPSEERAELDTARETIAQIQRKMILLGLSQSDIENVMARGQATGISTVTTPTTGVVLEQSAFKGTYVNTGEAVFVIANPTNIWARLDAYESDVPWLRMGQEAEFETDSFPGVIFKGKVVYLDPFFDRRTRTFNVGVLYTDPQTKLKPNMLVRAVIHARLTATGISVPEKSASDSAPLVIPETAPLLTGRRAIVYVEDPKNPGVFEARSVSLGPRSRDHYVVLEGLAEGERVVVNGNFKIDSALQILARPSMMEHRNAEPIAGQLPVHTGAEVVGEPPGHQPSTDQPRKGPQHNLYRGSP